MKLVWITDPHLDFLGPFDRKQFFKKIRSHRPQGIFLTGDISNGRMVAEDLRILSREFEFPIYFILGNHDRYESSFERVNEEVKNIIDLHGNLKYLEKLPAQTLTEEIGVVGVDGWYDAGFCEPLTSLVFAGDWFSIEDFRNLSSQTAKMELMRDLANTAAFKLGEKIIQAYKNHTTVYILTHIPPFPNSSHLFGSWGAKFWDPYNSSKIMSDILYRLSEEYPQHKMIVLSGHTHVKRREIIKPNLELRVGKGLHGVAGIEESIEI